MKEYFNKERHKSTVSELINTSENLTPREKKMYYGMLLTAVAFFIEGTNSPAGQRGGGDAVAIALALSLLAGIGINEYRKDRKSKQIKPEDDHNNDMEVQNLYPLYSFSEKDIKIKNTKGEIEVFSKAIDLDSFDLQKLTDDSSFVPDYKALDFMKGKDTKLIRFKEN